ncbi:hypothetical protein Tco_0940406 [Tanacetum coccineum]|uniref:Uncharacterized protein n=1 Tax=Tanacetum coccineum TaxID=301880 RepID=A0ABQ5DMX6_9ASTR
MANILANEMIGLSFPPTMESKHDSRACIYGALVSVDINEIFSNNEFLILDVGRKIISKDNGEGGFNVSSFMNEAISKSFWHCLEWTSGDGFLIQPSQFSTFQLLEIERINKEERFKKKDMSIEEIMSKKRLIDDEINDITNDLSYKRFRGEKIDDEYERDREIKIKQLLQDYSGLDIEMRKKERVLMEEKYLAASQQLRSSDSPPLPENESFSLDHFDDPSLPRPPPEPPDVEICFNFEPDAGDFNNKVVGDISEHDVLMPNLLPTQPTLCLVFDILLPFSSENEDKLFKPGTRSADMSVRGGRRRQYECVSTRSSSSSNLIPPFYDHESVIRNRRRNLGDPSLLLDFEEINMNPNNVQGPPPAGPPPQNHNGPPGLNNHMPAPDLRTMEELCQPTMNGRDGPIAPVNIQATDFGLKNHMIQQVQNSCQFHGFPGDDANKHLDKNLIVT